MLIISLMSCRNDNNWFYHDVQYSGEVTEPKMVLVADFQLGEYPVAYLMQSSFFQDVPAPETENLYTAEAQHYLTDGQVSMQINDGEWQTAVLVDDGYMCVMDTLCAGDLVRVRAYHSRFGEATAEQRIPHPIHAHLSVDRLPIRVDEHGFAQFTLHLDAYEGEASDVLRIQGMALTTTSFKFWIHPVHSIQHSIYAQDLGFAEFENFNYLQGYGYYGAGSVGMYYPLSLLQKPKSIPCLVYVGDKSDVLPPETQIDTSLIVLNLDEIDVVLTTMPYQQYLRHASLRLAKNDSFQSSFKAYGQDDNSLGERLLETIQRRFNAMGGLEAVQVYDNVEGDGIGFVGSGAKLIISIQNN